MSSVTFHTAVGGDGSTVTDDSSPAQLDKLFITASKL